MSDSALRAFIGRPVPAVHAGDVKRVWSFLASEQPPDPRFQGQTSFNLKLLAGLCGKGAGVLAVWFRATLVEAVRKEGRLERWREGTAYATRCLTLQRPSRFREDRPTPILARSSPHWIHLRPAAAGAVENFTSWI
jgi:hypothetical protein